MESAEEGPRPPAVSPAPGAPLELTARALLMGCAIGVLLSIGNGYMGLKTSFIDGGSVMAALLGFAFFATFKSRGSAPYSALETNITQTVASSASIMGYAIGLPGAIPALDLMGKRYPGWALWVWGVALGLIGVIMGILLRRKLVLSERLPFPTGAATAEVIETMSTARQTAIRRARFLVAAAITTAVFVWFRDGRPSVIPQVTMFGGAILGISLANLTVGLSFSPLMFSTGMLIGPRNALSMLLGAIIAWIFGAPLLVHHGIVANASFAACSGWLVWPGVGLLLASAFVPLAMDWRGLVRSFRDAGALFRRRSDTAEGPPNALETFRLAKPLFLVCVIVLVVVGRVAFDLSPLMTLVGLFIALILANVCARSAGETDIAPTGAMGTMTQLLFTGNGPVPSLIAGSIAAGVATQSSQTLWAFKAGDRLRASARAQIWAQMLGTGVGALVAVPVYLIMTSAYRLGTETLPAPSAMSWKATADAVQGGLSALPPHAPLAGAIAFGVGVVLTVLAPSRWGKVLPLAGPLGMSVLTPFTLDLAIGLGGITILLIKRLRPEADDATLTATAAGGIAGESVMGVLVAALIATGLL